MINFNSVKKIVILKNNGGRLANQLWLFSNVYAYCLEKKYICENRSFFRYYQYFDINRPSGFAGLFFNKNLGRSKFISFSYSIYSSFLKIMNKSIVINDNNNTFLLPPDKINNKNHKFILEKIDKSNLKIFYFCGWLFRTKNGLEKYRMEIKEYFKPQKKYLDNVEIFIKSLKRDNKKLIGVHIRHGDYKKWNNGNYFYSFDEVRIILQSYMDKQKNNKDILFIICSDEKIDDKSFEGLPYVKGLGSEIEDLYTLSYTDMIIGSNSTFGAWAAYYGNIPFKIFSRE